MEKAQVAANETLTKQEEKGLHKEEDQTIELLGQRG